MKTVLSLEKKDQICGIFHLKTPSTFPPDLIEDALSLTHAQGGRGAGELGLQP